MRPSIPGCGAAPAGRELGRLDVQATEATVRPPLDVEPEAAALAVLEATRRRTLELVAPLDAATLEAQHSPLMSPIVWDLGHVANFEAQWIARAYPSAHGREAGAACADHLYDAVAHARAVRRRLPLPSRGEALDYLAATRAVTRARVAAGASDPGALVRDGFVLLMLAQHEAQHAETILQTVQLAGVAYEPARRVRPTCAGTPPGGAVEVAVPGGPFVMGTDDRRLAYDNERPAHVVDVPAFRIDVAPVTNAAFAAFVAAGGYDRAALWSDAGWAWRQAVGVTHPGGWRPTGTGWAEAAFGRLEPLDPARPVVHVSWYEADAYARWAGRRLPTEAEWEKAAAWDPASGRSRRYPWGDAPPGPERANLDQRCFAPAAADTSSAGASAVGCHAMLGDVWEWTASDFEPYPGFEVFPYPEYSAIHFGRGYKVLRGASWAVQPLLARTTFRNWDLPERRQIFAGFRCAADA